MKQGVLREPAWTLTAACPGCGSDLVVRHTRQDHRPFIGCGNYPLCRFTCEYDTALQQLARREEVCAEDMRRLALLTLENENLKRENLRLIRRTVELAADVSALHRTATTRALPNQAHLTKALTHLIAAAHPDRWAQGQPATALAHELTTALLALRAQIQKAR